MKLTQEFLDAVARRVTPDKYLFRPSKPLELSKPAPVLTNITVLPRDSFRMKVRNFVRPIGMIDDIKAMTINVGRLMKLGKISEWERYLKTFAIYFNEDFGVLSALKLEFVYLHEIGHVDFAYRRQESWHVDNEEAYADYYAMRQLSKIYDEHIALTLLKRYGTHHAYKEGEKSA